MEDPKPWLVGEPNIDSIRLDWLSDPKNQFRYRIHPDGRVVASGDRWVIQAETLRDAVDVARCAAGAVPECVACGIVLNEQHLTPDSERLGAPRRRFHCPKCETDFYFGPNPAPRPLATEVD